MAQVRFRADEAGRSMNDYVTTVLRTATDPDFAATGAEQLRERLARAGLLAAPGSPRPRPDRAAVQAARRRAGAGTPLSDLVSSGRG